MNTSSLFNIFLETVVNIFLSVVKLKPHILCSVKSILIKGQEEARQVGGSWGKIPVWERLLLLKVSLAGAITGGRVTLTH